MTHADDEREYVETLIGYIEDAQAAHEILTDKLKQVQNLTEMWGGHSNPVMGILTASETNAQDLKNVRMRTKVIRVFLEDWWRNV